MEDRAETDRQIELLLERRAAVLGWPESESRDRILQALDATIGKLDSGRSSDQGARLFLPQQQ